MPGAAIRKLEVLRLARNGAQLQGVLAWGELQRLPEAAMGMAGEGASYSLSFALKADRGIRISGSCSAQVTLRCQRCMGELVRTIDAQIRVGVTRDEDGWRELEKGVEPVELDEEGRLDLYGFLEDELLLALPLIPAHDEADCHPPSGAAADAEGDERSDETHRPFAALAGLMRGSDDDPEEN